MKFCDASIHSDLIWEKESDPEGHYTLDFGWNKIEPQDEAFFYRDYLAIQEFSRAFPDAKRVVLAYLDGDFTPLIQLNETLKAEQKRENLSLEVFCAQMVSDYLHKLASGLPEEATPTIVVCPKKEIDRALLILLFSKRRFEHFEVLFQKEVLPIEGEASTIISLPQDERFDVSFFGKLIEKYDSVKCIPEEFLNEHWDEVSEIVYDSQTLGELGKRMLLGFEAAGGISKKAR